MSTPPHRRTPPIRTTPIEVTEMWDHVRREARRVANRAHHADDHPTYDTPAMIRTAATEVSGMDTLAFNLSDMVRPAGVQTELRTMQREVDALYARRKEQREAGKGATARRLSARSFRR